MRKNNLTLLTILAMFSFASCGDKSSTPTAPIVQTPGTLTITTTTSSTVLLDPVKYANSFAPDNATAYWIEDNNGKFITTLKVLTLSKMNWLTEWVSKSAKNTVNATTGATMHNYGTISCTWNGKDVSGTIVPDGTYKLRMELADDQDVPHGGDGVSAKFSASFTKGTTASTITAPNVTSFSNNTIQWTPAAQ